MLLKDARVSFLAPSSGALKGLVLRFRSSQGRLRVKLLGNSFNTDRSLVTCNICVAEVPLSLSLFFSETEACQSPTLRTHYFHCQG